MEILTGISLIVNLFLIWYVVKILRKLVFISENLSDLFLTVRAFEIFVESLYSMDSYNGEPVIQELIHKVKIVVEEIEIFREIFEYTIDEQLEEELNAAQEIKEE
jgi:hypothetical protein|tara:strand:+ start:60 stop:374 length:315 start_codon:yes stop_codon:yes gene_type:complete